ncbi:carboxypeptidase D-like isoform X2 [Glandiceps talaboti]
MRNLSTLYPDNTYLYDIGSSVQGRELTAMAIAGTKPDKHIPLRPEVKYVGNMHGNEVVGRELLLQFMEHLLLQYKNNDTEIKTFLDNTRVHILPTMNPDGFEVSVKSCNGTNGRYNANGFDLNRNFPDHFEENEAEIQKETQAVMDWLDDIQFTLSANLHGGALVANYPYDNIDPDKKVEGPSYPYSTSPDDDVFRNLSLVYSQNHENMHDIDFNDCSHVFGGSGSEDTEHGFKDGITNGAEWFPIIGGMQDYNYVRGGCMEVLMEVSCCKYPNEDELETFWDWNKKSLLEYLKQVNKGVKGQVLDENDRPIVGAKVSIKDRDIPFRTGVDGDYWRVLLPGEYVIVVEKDGYGKAEKSVTVSGELYDVTIQHFVLVESTSGAPCVFPLTAIVLSCLLSIRMTYL